jgi:hypothetical protein
VLKAVHFVSVITCRDKVAMSYWLLCYKNDKAQCLPMLPASRQKIIGAAQQNYRVSPELQHN